MKKFYKGLLACISTFTLVMCTKGNGSNKEYTYREVIGGTPAEWNPHILTSANSNFISSLTTIGFVQMGMKEDKTHQWTMEMADSISDVTNGFTNKEKYGIPSDAESSYVYEVKLNQNACWQDGTLIDADTYIYSMKQLLDYEMKNPQSVTYTDGKLALYKAKDYMYRGQVTYEWLSIGQTYEIINGYAYNLEGDPLIVAVDESNPNLNQQSSLRTFHENSASLFLDGDGNDVFTVLDTGNDHAPLSEAMLEALKVIARNFGNESVWSLMAMRAKTYSANWEDVGFYKVDKYTLMFVMKNATSRADLISAFNQAHFLVYERLYEAGKTVVEGLKTTNYGTSVKTYMSYGPYKLVSIEKDKQIVLAKNDKWYGYSDGRHIGQYQTTKVYGEVIKTHEDAMNAFLKGEIEAVDLQVTDMNKYGYSDYLLRADESFIFSICLNGNLEQLKALENAAADGSNKRVGAYKSFKEGLSWAINRTRFVNEGTTGGKVQFGLFNKNYYYDAENNPNSIYRNSEYGMKSIVNHYQVEYGEDKEYKTLKEAYDSITGYDVIKARALFQQAYEEMKADGNYVDGQAIKLNCLATEQATIDEAKQLQNRILNEFIADATVGTGFENKITVTFVSSKDNWKDFHDGNYEMYIGQKSGAEFNPFYQIRRYIVDGEFTVPEVACYDPRNETLELEINKIKETRTIRQWGNTLNNGGDYYNASLEVKLTILSALEQYLIDQFIDIPVYSRGKALLSSKKINQGTTEYNLFYQFGGIRHMTYNYTDAEWASYVKKSGGTLKYE